MKSFNYYQPTQILFGKGRISELGSLTSKFGKRCVLVTSGGSSGLKSTYSKVIRILGDAGIETAHFDKVIPNPTTETIRAGAELAKEFEADVVVGMGGGSSMDAAKAIAVEATHEGSCWDYLFYKKEPTHKTLPMIAVSTSSGTGSQVTQVSVVTNEKENDKSALYHSLLFPRACIIDPELMLTLPREQTAFTGFDAFCHAFESILHPGCGTYVEDLAIKAIQTVADNLPVALHDPGNIEARSQMAWADTLAGMCIASAGVTLPHGMGMAIGGLYPHVAHGEALAIVYPACMDFTWSSAIPQFARIGRIFDPALSNASDRVAAEQSCIAVRDFLNNIGINKRLRDVNMPESEIERLARQSMVLPDYQNNPRLASDSEMVELVRSSY